jgi:actin-like ATPase involved in cell morphogenesis
MYDPLGLSIGTTNLVAVRDGSPPVTRRAVLTLFPHRAPEIGVPAENPNLTEPGMLMNGFVRHMGESVALVSADGSSHDPGLLVVEALDALASAAGADAASSEIAIAVPAHWGPEAVQALRDALRTHAGFVRSGMAPRLVSDNVAALTAVNAGPGLPSSGVVGLLDFGGGGTTITLADAGSGFEPITDAVRYSEFSGEQIDQALRAHVLESIGHTGNGDPEATAAIGQLAQLREECRQAKEFLSTQTITELAVELPGYRSSVEVTRAQLECLMQDRLTGVISAFEDMLARNNIGWANLAAVAMVGGGASIPLVAQRLSAHTRAPVVMAPQPALAMAVGAAMLASSDSEVDVPTRTAMAAVAGGGDTTGILGLAADNVIESEERSSTVRQLAWSEAEDTGDEPVPYLDDPYDELGSGAAPVSYAPKTEPPEEPPRPRFRMARLVVGLAALVAMFAIGAVAYTLTSTTERKAPPAPSTAVPPPPPSSQPPAPSPIAPPPPSVAPTPSLAPPPSVAPAPSSPEPPPPPPPAPVTTTYQPPPTTTTTTMAPTTTTTTTTAPTTTTTTSPPPTTTTTTTTVPMTTEYLTVPLVPVPIPIQVPQSQVNPNQPQNPFLNPGGG